MSLLVSDYWQGQIDDLRIYHGYPLNSASTTGTTAMAFGGTGSAYNNKYAATPATTAFTVECLIRVGPGQSGIIAGFSAGGTTDRLLYVDAAWHHLTASVGPITGTGALAAGGLRLSLDGTVTSTSAVTAAIASTGVWRWGGTPLLLPLTTWPAAPGNPYLTGTLDELAVYDKQLTDQDDLWRVYGNY
ncbi:hypothetical protein Ate02nite_57480 [Paractinoplanes tereljensis]|uniref:LamG-like jellyroll fold domain-containing protein n=1 Tax=Paractinoplanes tereljensis TaxID=571912 RepID=A0A919NQW7_9ACTN|nr:hypothetical protein Ate02nite_57480 [Actinoplanes tereljensis]